MRIADPPAPALVGKKLKSMVDFMAGQQRLKGQVKEKDVRRYFETGRGWEDDLINSAIQSKKRAWVLASTSAVIAGRLLSR